MTDEEYIMGSNGNWLREWGLVKDRQKRGIKWK